MVQTCSPNSYRTSTRKITGSRLPQYVVTQQVAASSCFWHIFRTWCQVTTKLPAQVFVSIQLDLNASWIAHLFIIPLSSLYVLGSEVKPFLWLPPLRPTCSLLLALSRNLPAASPIVQQSSTIVLSWTMSLLQILGTHNVNKSLCDGFQLGQVHGRGAYRSIKKQLKLHRFDSTMPWAQAVTTKNSPKLLHR